MKVDLVGKFKWYIIGFILVAIMLSVSLSFCAWDTLSYQAKLENSGSGEYNEYVKLVEDNFLPNNISGQNGLADVGDVVTFGNFYQDTNSITTATTAPQRWRVVEYNKTTQVATLFAEKTVTYGNYWGSTGQNMNDYYRSTVRSWLNSGKGSLKGSGTNWDDSVNGRHNDNIRNDGLNYGKSFGINESQVNKGFLDVAFSEKEKSILVPREFSDMQYYQADEGVTNCKTQEGRTSINDLVWLPSFQEIFGTISAPGGMPIDGESSQSQFSYFKEGGRVMVGATPYALNAVNTSYNNNGGSGIDYPEAAPTDSRCWLRSACPALWYSSLIIELYGHMGNAFTFLDLGVRPAVCIQL